MSDSQAQSLLKKAEEKENYKSWFGGNKLDEAYDLYQQAANGFKLSKNSKLSYSSVY
jgi:alpha-soluble NSF attachment protein